MKEIIKLGLILLLVCVVAAFALAVTNELTKDQIASQREKASEEARKAILPNADSFKSLEEIDKDKFNEILSNNDKIAEVFAGYKSDSIVGYTFKTLPSGYGGTVEVMTGIDIEGTISGVRVGNHQETPGLGANAELPDFYDQYKDKSIDKEIEVSKVEPTKDNEIQAISGATITSNAVTSGVNIAINTFKEITGK
ncbi:RnfABCDGE type electron transport complex subunit G [Paramaledivibacter caminithermalis]|jgi:electron transport complex protein RnfG|uniref:Ion-translocating oxidoreductase complex subunit G n=1 Tax=Paramaledivibacter caminithermalis (strain DSM 15212 / CIP 107654 / DViRD3) TaxID=1121301 RepID=A0A1M6MET9_PARC5|nr:RnfABCDGE type electron transport complex subunit G [Paramaledivibacter caminithermalis]SHJ81974.1 electron transport complex protein RnfG [Paramaledivibacter caminithermalis DSM 15212]